MNDPVKEAIDNLRDYGFDIRRPARVEYRELQDKVGGKYMPLSDTIVIDTSGSFSDEELVSLEHELLHKWQYDQGASWSRLSKAINMIAENYDNARKFFSQANMRLPSYPSEIKEIKFFKLLLAYIELVEDHPEFKVPEKELEKLERKGEKIHQKMLEENVDIDDPNDQRAKELNQRLNEVKSEISNLRNRPQQECREFLEEELERNDHEIDRYMEVLRKRQKLTDDLDSLVSVEGEAMSYYWSLHRFGYLDDQIDRVLKHIELISDEGYDENMIDSFRKIYSEFYLSLDGNDYEAAFKEGLKFSAELVRDKRKKKLEG
ncbi:MAG: hypothetical protein ACI83Q_000206 [Colwellia polaris]|jgi:hypothetical protein